MKHVLIVFLFILCFSCKDVSSSDTSDFQLNPIALKYAKGFKISELGEHKVLEITRPWPNATMSNSYLILSPTSETKTNLIHNFDGTIIKPIEDIVVTSTTHIPSLELLQVEDKLIGFPETEYISSSKTRQRVDEGKLRDLGKNESINTEVLLELNPDVVVGFGVDGVNKTFETIRKTGVPVIYNGDWAEDNALAKAEWIKFFGVLFHKEREADSIFNSIEDNYLQAKSIADSSTSHPTVLSGALHKEVWYLPYGNSPEGQMLKDANVNYLWQNTVGTGSIGLSFETVYNVAKDADIWISPSYYSSYEQLKAANELYTNFEAFKSKSIYSFVNTTGDTGGVLYYELGICRPDLVLKDLIKIAHPTLLPEYELTFFKSLP
ncbi:MAG: ABC transporter substrate-binding protein [Winogradskyella sp.]|nr:ABC transporter substrate-binding protein [Winogradskyella sp.]